MTEPTADMIERRLQQWAAWVGCGKAAVGFPVTNVLHKSWSPPTTGSRPTPRVIGCSDRLERATHRAVELLPIRLRNTVVVVYVQKLDVTERSLRLNCQASTVRARISAAKVRLSVLMCVERGFTS